MKTSLIIPSYIEWHYTDALRNIWGIFTNFVWFLYHFFSVPVLLRTMFSPWHKLGEKYKKGFNPGAFFSTLLVNIILRIVGFVIRTVVLVFVFAMMAGITFAVAAFYIIWIFMPGILFLLFITSVNFFSI